MLQERVKVLVPSRFHGVEPDRSRGKAKPQGLPRVPRRDRGGEGYIGHCGDITFAEG